MFWIYLAFLVSVAVRASALSCYSCSSGNFDGEITRYRSSCYDISGSTVVDSCSIAFPDYYCRTQFSVRDGIVARVQRACVRGSSDNDQSTNWMPTANKCRSNLYYTSSSDLEQSEFYYHCNDTDNCNTVTVSTLKTCGTDCGYASRGYCDYISGKCACRSGWSGLDCSNAVVVAPTPRRKCVQCFSETDLGCTTKKDGAYCPSNEQYCSSTQTSIFKQNEVVRTILIRGCTNSHIAVDECKFTNIYSDNGINDRGYNEFTCYSTCDTDNCNTNTPDGVLNGSEKPLLKCAQCASTGFSCSPSSTFCPSESTHCKSTVTYVISDKVDARYRVDSPSSYKILSTVRECATSPVTADCTETKIENLSLKNVTCQETCQDDGCNTGWPARPKCIRCSGSTCLKSPGQAYDCSYPYQQYCTIRDHGLQEGTRETLDGYPRVTYRGCSYVDIGTGCTKTILRDKSIQTCNYTCSTDGCNVGSGSSSVDPKINVAAALVLLALCIQWDIILS